MDVIKYMEQFFREVAQVIQKIDEDMKKEGWEHLYRSTVTAGLSKDLGQPDQWLPYWNFRIYSKNRKSNLIKAVSICYDSDKVEQPIIIAGLVEYKKPRNDWNDYWAFWYLWLEDENKSKKLDGTVYQLKSSDKDYKEMVKRAKAFAYNIVDIKNEDDIKTKISNKLIELS